MNQVWIESCIRCAPGYDLARTYDKGSLQFICNPQTGKLSVEFFIAPYDNKILDVDKQSGGFDTTVTYEEWKGFSMSNPYYALQNI